MAIGVAMVLAVTVCGCGGSSPIAAQLPDYQPEGQSKCAATKSQDRPLIIEWPANERAALESRLRQGVVPVRYVGCEMRVLSRCRSDVAYGYQGVTRESEEVKIDDVDTLYANLPFGAVAFEGHVESGGSLRVSMVIAGRYEAEADTIRADQLTGADCPEATHLVLAVNVGAYELVANAERSAGASVDVLGKGGGGKHESQRGRQKRGGDRNSCQAAGRKDSEPPEGCSALLRLEVVPVGEPRLPSPVCPAGSRWNGTQCVRTQVLTKLSCPAGTRLRGRICEPKVSRSCPTGMRYQEGRGCLPVGSRAPTRPAKLTRRSNPLGAPTPKRPEKKKKDSSLWVLGLVSGLSATGLIVGLVVNGIMSKAEPEVIPPPEGRGGGLDSAPLRWEF